MGRRKQQSEETMERLPKALSPAEIDRMVFDTLPWESKWSDAFGEPERKGVWIIWGASGSGKTSFAMQLAKELSKYYKVAYNSLEQGKSLTMQQIMRQHNMKEIRKQGCGLISEDMDVLARRLRSKGAPDVVIIDSVQYTLFDRPRGLQQYLEFAKEFKRKNKLLIFISHADGKNLEGTTAEKISYDADMKIFLEGYRAISKGRIFGSSPDTYYTIWEEGAARYWLKKEQRND